MKSLNEQDEQHVAEDFQGPPGEPPVRVQPVVGCGGCVEKQKIINILHDTCAGYEARIKRFQTLRRKRRAAK